jgi:hypothetical protein
MKIDAIGRRNLGEGLFFRQNLQDNLGVEGQRISLCTGVVIPSMSQIGG